MRNPYEAPKAQATARSTRERGRLAPLWKRALGYVIDSLVVVLVAAVLARIAAHVAGSERTVASIEAWMLVPFIAQWVLIVLRGQSVAKILLRMRIVRTNGAKVDFITGVALRAWPILAIQLLPKLAGLQARGTWLFMLADGAFIFGATRRCLHDRLADTHVVDA